MPLVKVLLHKRLSKQMKQARLQQFRRLARDVYLVRSVAISPIIVEAIWPREEEIVYHCDTDFRIYDEAEKDK